MLRLAEGLVADRTRVGGGFRFLVQTGRFLPPFVRVCEEVDVFAGMHAEHHIDTELVRFANRADPCLSERGANALDALGDLRWRHQSTAVEERAARMVLAMSVRRDDEHPAHVARNHRACPPIRSRQ